MAEKKDRKIEDILNRDGRFMRGPVLWFLLLAIPVVISLAVAFREQPTEGAEEAAIEEIAEAAVDTSPPAFNPDAFHQETTREAQTPEMPYEGRAALVARYGKKKPPANAVQAPQACDFNEWVGRPGVEAESVLKAQNRVVRVLPPGSRMTMDHSPERLNLDVDANGNVTRVWCG